MIRNYWGVDALSALCFPTSGGFEAIGEAAEGDREPAAETEKNTPARARRDHA
jgi:hypothetical protein